MAVHRERSLPTTGPAAFESEWAPPQRLVNVEVQAGRRCSRGPSRTIRAFDKVVTAGGRLARKGPGLGQVTRKIYSRRLERERCISGFPLASLMGVTAVAVAQSVSSVPAAPSYRVTSPPGAGTPVIAPAFAEAAPAIFESSADTLGEWVRRVRLRARYSFSYGKGMLVSPGEDDATITQTVAPSIDLRLSDQWFFTYTPSFTFYSSDRYQDTVGHSLGLSGRFGNEAWQFSVGQTYAFTSETLVETARQTDQQTLGTTLGASHALNSRLFLQLGASQNVRVTAEYSDYWDWATMNWLDYQFAPTLSFGPGLGFGYTLVEPGTDMMYEQYQARFNWQLTRRFSLAVQGGLEVRQRLDSGLPDLLSPLFSGSLGWQLFEHTRLSASASHSLSPSYDAGQVTESTTVGGSFNQRLLKRLDFTAGVGYRTGQYLATEVGAEAGRNDDTLYYSVRLGTGFLRKGSVGAFYSHSENLSNREDFSYSSQQVGFDIGYHW